MSGGTENVDDFVLVELFESIACGTEILSRIEFRRLLIEDLADRGGHGKTSIGVDVDLADGALRGEAELFFASLSFPPLSLMILTRSCGTLEDP